MINLCRLALGGQTAKNLRACQRKWVAKRNANWTQVENLRWLVFFRTLSAVYTPWFWVWVGVKTGTTKTVYLLFTIHWIHNWTETTLAYNESAYSCYSLNRKKSILVRKNISLVFAFVFPLKLSCFRDIMCVHKTWNGQPLLLQKRAK